MAFDAMLLRRLACVQQPVLHLYEWEAPSITYGYFLDPDKIFSLNNVRTLGVQIARRPTGGGAIAHVTDLAFSMLIPAAHPAFSTNTLDNYAYINKIIADIVREFVPSGSSLKLFRAKAAAPKARCLFAWPILLSMMSWSMGKRL